METRTSIMLTFLSPRQIPDLYLLRRLAFPCTREPPTRLATLSNTSRPRQEASSDPPNTTCETRRILSSDITQRCMRGCPSRPKGRGRVVHHQQYEEVCQPWQPGGKQPLAECNSTPERLAPYVGHSSLGTATKRGPIGCVYLLHRWNDRVRPVLLALPESRAAAFA